MNDQIQNTIQDIIFFVERSTGLTSRWNGVILVETSVDPSGLPYRNGAKDWDCCIILHDTRALMPQIYSTGLHEAFHSVSIGLTEQSYLTFRGYEEGVVEMMTRIHLPDLHLLFGNQIVPQPRRVYERYVNIMEQMRVVCGKSEKDFYLCLLQTPLEQRKEKAWNLIQANSSSL